MTYDAHPWRAAMMGRGWRELWRVPVMTEVLDLDGFAGGLTVVRRGGGKQTSSLRLRGEDGALYQFRSIDKDAARGLDTPTNGAGPASRKGGSSCSGPCRAIGTGL